MRPSRIASGLLLLVLPAYLAGCGFFESEEREPWRAQAEAACYAHNLVHLSSYIQEGGAIRGRGICGIDRPLRVSALEDGAISLGSRALPLSCPMTAALEFWVRDTVMPAAYAYYGSPVVEIRNFGSYNCRSRNNVSGAPLSEHAFANAFDFAGVKLASGYVVTVKGGWYGSSTDRAFLRDVTAGACGPFTTVLGPGSDRSHEDHLHLDLARHNVKGTYHYCKPRPDVPTRPGGGVLMAGAGNPAPIARGMTVAKGVSASPDYRLPPVSSSGFARPLPPASVGVAATASARPAALPPVSAPASSGVAKSVPGCPAGFICTPVDRSLPTPVGGPSLGWRVGAPPVQGYGAQGYSADGIITGSITPYSDD